MKLYATILLILAITAATGFISVLGKPLQVPIVPEVEPAKESDLMVSRYFCISVSLHAVMMCHSHRELYLQVGDDTNG